MKYILSFILIFTYSLSFAQESVNKLPERSYSSLFPLNRDMLQLIDRFYITSENNADYYSENKPYYTSFETYLNVMRESKKYNSNKSFVAFIYNKFFIESLIKIKTDDVDITIDPLFNFGYGKFNSSESKLYNYNTTYINTRGLIIRGMIGKKRNVTFYSTLYENQGRFIDYVDAFVKSHTVLPGEGVVKNFKNDSYRYDFSSATGVVAWAPSSHFNFQFGHAKNFIGDGYRSLLLSDNSFNYPFLKTKFDLGKFEYTNIYASYQIAKHHSENIYTRKYATMHLLSWNVIKGLNIAVFESTIWKAKDGNLNLPFKAKYLNPIIGIQTISTGLDGMDNTMTGLNLSYNFSKHHSVYSQLVVDDLDVSGKNNYKNKLGFQIGYKYFDVMNIQNLYFQAEYNVVKPYTYAYKDSVQSFSHYNQALAHPLGANFRESVSFLNYRWRDFLVELKFNYAVYGADSANYDFGQNILLSQNPDKYSITTTDSKIAQGVKNTLIYKSFRIYYYLNPVTNMCVYLEFQDRNQKFDIIKYHSTYLNFGFKTNLDNFYYDF